MGMMPMKFKSFLWRNNPTELTVRFARNVRETALPFAGSVSRDLGAARRRVTGKGFFVGEDCLAQFEALQGCFDSGGSGMLQLPGQKPFPAMLEELRLVGVAGENVVQYAFSFLEGESGGNGAGRRIYPAQAGESLWDVAYRFGRDMEALVAANPQIRTIGALEEGEKVNLP